MSLETLRQNFALSKKGIKGLENGAEKIDDKDKKVKTIREILRERTIEQFRLVRG
jgi:hypothetical protein